MFYDIPPAIEVSYNLANPLHPLNPLNPVHPASPLNPTRRHRQDREQSEENKEDLQISTEDLEKAKEQLEDAKKQLDEINEKLSPYIKEEKRKPKKEESSFWSDQKDAKLGIICLLIGIAFGYIISLIIKKGDH